MEGVMADSRKYYRSNSGMITGGWTPEMIAYLLAHKLPKLFRDAVTTDEHSHWLVLRMANGQRFRVDVTRAVRC
jgi:hypothetical protein